ncbi:MAG TPA: glycoside hydrolase family 3 protein [Ktedonobacteraceae bacterium]|nr:glycoside hydrolase family 3 protein [Ktedonobacteraceae bacterium]
MDEATSRRSSEQSSNSINLEVTHEVEAIPSPDQTSARLELSSRAPLLIPAAAASIVRSEREKRQESAGEGEQNKQEENFALAAITTIKMPRTLSNGKKAVPVLTTAVHVNDLKAKDSFSRWKVVPFIALLCILVFNASNQSLSQFIGAQGWSSVLAGSASSNDNVLNKINQQLHATSTPGTTARRQMTPQQYIDLIVQNMTLDQKLGQMMIVQFVGPEYSYDISTMISQYDIGAVLLFTANNNIVSKPQLKGLIQQMQQNSSVPLIVAIDQEGGTVDRLASLDGPEPSETAIGATNDPNRAQEEGVQVAQDLAYYGFNLNLAPVVDVNDVYNPQLYMRTYGNNPALVTRMASAYLQGLQQSGKVLGTLKHFPGLGDVSADPHATLPQLTRPLSQLEAIDWAPYRALIAQGNVHAILVTHEIVQAVDPNTISSLSYKVVTGILRDQLGFQGVVITDSLTMEGVSAYYTEAQAAVMAIQAGDDLLMGASTPSDVASMIQGIKQAINNGQISQQRIDDSVRRILMLKYQMGLLPLPKS